MRPRVKRLFEVMVPSLVAGAVGLGIGKYVRDHMREPPAARCLGEARVEQWRDGTVELHGCAVSVVIRLGSRAEAEEMHRLVSRAMEKR